MKNKNTKERQVLIIDNDKESVQEFKHVFRVNDVEVKNKLKFDFAKNCKEAMDRFKKKKFDLIVLEIVLPIVNGYHLLDYLKKTKNKSSLIIYTKLRGEKDLEKLIKYKIDNIFLKQITSVSDLIDAIISNEKKKNINHVVKDLEENLNSYSDENQTEKVKTIQCPRCKMLLSPGSHFCNNCGQKIY